MPVVDELRARLTDDLGRLAAQHGVPGASVAVLIGDDVVEATCGVINTRTGEPVTPDTLFMIQSITKVITATLVLQLVDDQLVGPDDLVSDHLPGFGTADPEAGARITVRHLLTHTGGFEGDLWAATTSGDDALQRFVEDLVSHAPQHSAPGERFSYCNAGFGVLGRLVEVQRGMTYEQALRRFVTGPLGVDEVAFSADQALAFRTATGHVRPEPGAPQRPLFNWAVMPPSNPAAGNQLAMSARALLEFARMHLAEGRASGGGAVLSPASVRRMRERQVAHPAMHGAQSSHGLGWWLERGELVEHAGGNIGVSSMLRLAPRHGVAAVVLTNGEGGGALIDDVLEPLFADLPGVTPSEPVSAARSCPGERPAPLPRSVRVPRRPEHDRAAMTRADSGESPRRSTRASRCSGGPGPRSEPRSNDASSASWATTALSSWTTTRLRPVSWSSSNATLMVALAISTRVLASLRASTDGRRPSSMIRTGTGLP